MLNKTFSIILYLNKGINIHGQVHVINICFAKQYTLTEEITPLYQAAASVVTLVKLSNTKL